MKNIKLGYYTCNGIHFDTKIKAMIYGNSQRLPVQWHFNDVEFGSYNWDTEPPFTLDQLYDQRARSIREQYDYVILSYSGGSDSNNILESFIRQGLHIDEIVTNWALDITEKYLDHSGNNRESWNNNAEFKLNTVHRLQYIKDKCPRTKITVNDTSKALVAGLITTDDPSWIETRNDSLNITGISNYNVSYFTEMRKTFDRHKKIAFVIGIDKPKLRIIDDKLYLFFIDKVTNLIPVDQHLHDYPNTTPLFFYWDPDSSAIIAKQAHTVLRYINANPQLKTIFERTDLQTRRRTQEELLKFILYPDTWSNQYWQINKVMNDWDCELDYWFTRGWRDTAEYKIWFNGLKTLAPKISNYIITKNGLAEGTLPLLSKLYYIGDVKTL